jgi:hypothetical protein
MTEDDVRRLIHEAAALDPSVGVLDESLKWGQPSFTPARPGIGSSVRIEAREDGRYALMFICTTPLVDDFRALYADVLTLEGKRAIVLDEGFDRAAVRHCIALALTHKRRKRDAAR